MYNAQLACGVIPAKPLIVVGQMTTTDPTRSPAGTEVLWAYAHVPQNVRGDAGGDLTGAWTPPEVEEFADRIEARIETKAPGFGDRIRARHVMGPPRMQELNPSLVHGALNVGTAQLYQQLIFRPTPAMGRPTTPIRNVYLASGSAHPGGECTGRRARMPPPWPCAATPAAAWRPGPAASGPGAEPGRSRAARPGAGAAGPPPAAVDGRDRHGCGQGPDGVRGREGRVRWWRSSGRPPVGQARRHPVGGQQQPGDGAGGGLPAGTAGTADDRGGDPFRGVGRRDGPQLAAGVVGRALEHGRVHRAGQDQADVDPRVAGDRLAQVEGQAAGGVLGHGVQRHLGVGHDPEQGPDDHQGPVALGLEGGQRGPGAEGGPDHVDVDQPLHGTGVGDVGRHRQHLDPGPDRPARPHPAPRGPGPPAPAEPRARRTPARLPGRSRRGTGDHDDRTPDLPTRAHPTSTRSQPGPGCPGMSSHNPYAPRTARGCRPPSGRVGVDSHRRRARVT